MNDTTAHLVAIGKIDTDGDNQNVAQIDMDDLPILATRDLVLFPGVTFPISLGREQSVKVARFSSENNETIGLVCQRDASVESPGLADLYEWGVLARVLNIFELPDGSKTAILVGGSRFHIEGVGVGAKLPGVLSARVAVVDEVAPQEDDEEFAELTRMVKETTVAILKHSGETSPEMAFNINNSPSPMMLMGLVATHTPLTPDEKIGLLATSDIKQRAYGLMRLLNVELDKATLLDDIRDRVKAEMTGSQRQAFMQTQIDILHSQLYGDEGEAGVLRRRFEALGPVSDELKKAFDKEMARLARLNPQGPDYSVLYNYIETLIELPWNTVDDLNTDFGKAEKVLESRHYGLEKVKERILEQLAVMMNTPEAKAPIICLVGAPGVGKTSLGASIAEALGRKFRRISLGGLHDESEIRGHRRTYIGAMPGRIMSAIRKAGTSNPVLMLDEIDKVSSDYHGDPQAALLEVLDPEQNCRFHDNYIDVDFDLSRVMFITTANSLSSISQPLLDRMEVIDISGYLLEEKIEIARRHFIPDILLANGFKKGKIRFTDEALTAVIEGYTAESGVRQLRNRIETIVRRIVLKKMRGQKFPCIIKPDHLKDLLGTPRYSPERYEANDIPGVVTGLAWTAVGGAILFVESLLSPSREGKLSMTGNLGDVMKESATIAFQWVKAHASQLNIDPEMFTGNNLHIHVPEGATPKDGPSAGITMATSIVSAFTGRPVIKGTAMTGEITLRGKVLPVGGIKEKILAARRAGLTRIILCEENRRDINDIKAAYLEGLEFIYVTTVDQVLEAALRK